MGKRALAPVTGQATPAQRRKTAAQQVAPAPPSNAINARVQAMLAQCDSDVKSHWTDLQTSPPTQASGTAPYDTKLAATLLGGEKTYTCSIPWTWLNHSFELQPNVPKYETRLHKLKDHFFSQPRFLPECIEVHLSSGELPHKMVGSLNPMDAPELRDAMRMAVAEAVRENRPRKEMQEWKSILLSTVVKFSVVDASNRVQQIFRTVVQKREDIGVRQENQGMTSLMRVFEIQEFKKVLQQTERSTNKHALAEEYAKIKFAERSEPVKPSFIEVATMLANAVVSVPEVRDVLLQMDQLPFNPLDSVYKYREVTILCEKKPAQMLWVFSMLMDRWQILDGKRSKDGIPIRALKTDADAFGLVPLCLWKKQLRDYLYREMDTRFVWPDDVKQELRKVTASLETVRACLGIYDLPQDGQQVSFEARATWPKSADLFLTVFEVMVFGYSYDTTIMPMLLNRKVMEDILNHQTLRPADSRAFGLVCLPSDH